MDLNQYYQSGRYKDPDFFSEGRYSYLRKRCDWIKKELPVLIYGKILDVGCGDGFLLAQLKISIPSLELFGTDISKRGCKLSIKQGIKAKIGDLNYRIPFESDKFDFIIGHEIIEHLWNTDKFLSECYRCLKKGGFLILTTPNLVSWYSRLLILFGVHSPSAEMSTFDRRIGFGIIKPFIKTIQPLGHLRIFTVSALIDLASLHKFHVEKVKGSNVNLFGMNPVLSLFSVLDYLFSFIPSFSSDILIILRKSSTQA